MFLDHPVITERLFHPRGSREEPTLPVEVGGARLGCFRFDEHPGAGTLLHFHGNGELAAEYATEGYADLFLGMGVNVCFAEYRGYGASTGAPSLGAMLGDGEAIVRALGVPPSRIVAYGRSLGAVYAIELARRLPDLAGLIVESGVADVDESLRLLVGGPAALGCTEAEFTSALAAEADLRGAIASYRGPTLILHASGDALIPPSQALRLRDASGCPDPRLRLLDRGDHNSVLSANLDEWRAEVGSLLRDAGIAV